MKPRTRSFRHEGFKLVYDEYGSGERTVILTPGLLFSRKMHGPLAQTLATRGYRVVCLDLLGHGDSDRPPEMWHYSMPLFGRQVLGADGPPGGGEGGAGGHLAGRQRHARGRGRRPGARAGAADRDAGAGQRVAGCAIAFTPLLISLTFGAPVTRTLAGVADRLPRRGPLLGQMLHDWVAQDPKPSASVLQGLFFGRTAPPRSERSTFEPPTLVIGHPRDPIHPFSDSDMLVRELPNARLIEASSIIELRTSPERLTGEIVGFIDECWGGRARPARRRRAPAKRSTNGSRAAGARRRPA